MSFPFIYFLIDSTLYSIRTIMRKTLVDQFTVPNYIITSYLFRMILMIPFIIYFWKDYTAPKNLNLVYKNSHIFIILTFIGFITGFVFTYIIKKTPISYSIPLSFMLSNIFITALGIMVLHEKITNLRIAGLILGSISLFLLA